MRQRILTHKTRKANVKAKNFAKQGEPWEVRKEKERLVKHRRFKALMRYGY